MSPELITAIRERIEQSQPKEDIRDQVLAMGHSPEVFEAAYVLALHDVKESVIQSAYTPQFNVKDVPRVKSLVVESFHFAVSHWYLALFLALPILISYLASTLGETYTSHPVLSLSFHVVSVIALIVYLYVLTAVLYQVGKVKKGEAGLKSAFSFAQGNFFLLLGIYLLTMLAAWGGFILFIIPGIILSTTLYFAPFVFLHENKRGMSALMGSRSLVKGRWWFVTLKLFKYMMVVFLPLIIISAIITVLTESVSWWHEDFSLRIAEALLEPLVAFVTVMSLYAMNDLYHGLTLTKTVASEEEKGARNKYWALVMIGLVSFVLLAAAAAVYAPKLDEQELVSLTDALDLEQTVLAAYANAAEYKEHNGSFSGVCGALTADTTDLFTRECNDSSNAWAFSVSSGGEVWCADTETPAKRIGQGLGDRTECLDLP